MVATTRVSKGFQTVVPASLRRRFGLGPGDEVIWTVLGDEVYIRVRKVGGEDPLGTDRRASDGRGVRRHSRAGRGRLWK